MDAAGNKTGGRQKGTPNKATAEVRALAREYGPAAFVELAKLAGLAKDEAGTRLPGASSETARISAIGMLIERGYGKAVAGRAIQIELPDTSTGDGVVNAIAAVIQSMSAGEITPSEASDLCSVLESQRRAIDTVSLEARLAKLEGERRVTA